MMIYEQLIQDVTFNVSASLMHVAQALQREIKALIDNILDSYHSHGSYS